MGTAGAYYVYILASSRHGTLYIGVTNNLPMRLDQHRRGRGSEFVKRYGVHILVHVEEFASPQEAIACEKQLKNWQPYYSSSLFRLASASLTSRSFSSSKTITRFAPAPSRTLPVTGIMRRTSI